MSLSDEWRERRMRDGLDTSKFYCCPHCYTITESYNPVEECPACKWQGELTAGSSQETAARIIEEMKHPEYNPNLGRRNQPERNEREERRVELAMQLSRRTGFLAAARAFVDEQPVYYDSARLWWVWNFSASRWECTDHVTILNLVTDTLRLFGDVSVKSKDLLLSAIMQEARRKKPVEFPKHWIQFKDQIYDIQKREIVGNATPEYFCVNTIPWRLGATEDTPTIDKLFNDWVGPDWMLTLQQVAAYCCITEYPIQTIICLHGGGRNGKTKFQGFIQRLVGMENICSTELDAITNTNRTFERFTLYKKLVCLMGETSYETLRDPSLLKKLTGEDLINFQKKFADAFNDYNYAKIIVNSNGVPNTDDKSDGYYRRWLIIDFPNQFPEGKDILKSIPLVEYENFCRKITRILPELLDRGQFHNHGSIEERKARYEQRANPLTEFIEQFCVIDEQSHIKYGTLYTKYTHWLTLQKRRQVTRKEFTNTLTMNGYEIDKTSLRNAEGQFESGRFVLGLRFKEMVPDFGTYSPSIPHMPDVTRVYTTLHAHSEEYNQCHIGHIGTTGAINAGGSIIDDTKAPAQTLASKALILENLRTLGEASTELLQGLYPGEPVSDLLEKMRSEGEVYNPHPDIWRVLE